MCSTTQTQQMPLNAPPVTSNDPNDPLKGLVSDTPNQTVPVKTPTTMGRVAEVASGGMYDPTGGADSTKQVPGHPTKFSALMDIVRPALEGAAIGGLTGRATPGGGFAGANNFYLQQRMRQMQLGQFAMQMANMQSQIAKNQADTAWTLRRPVLTRTSNTIKGTDDQGNPVFKSQNPNTGEWETVQGITPEGPQPDLATVPTNQGIVEYDRRGVKPGAIPLTLANQVDQGIKEGTGDSSGAPSRTAQGQGTKFVATGANGTLQAEPDEPQGSPMQSPANVPLMPPGVDKAKPTRVTNRDAAGRETDSIIDENPDSPTFGQALKQNIASRAPTPSTTTKDQGPKTDLSSRIESYASAALQQSGNDPDKAITLLNNLKVSDPAAAKEFEGLLPQIRNRIRERIKPGKTGKQPRITPDQAKQFGLTPTQSSMSGDEDQDEQ